MTDRKITVRFFEVTDSKENGEALDVVLKRLAGMTLTQRQKDIGDELQLTLEYIKQDGDLWFGDMSRVQVENLPGFMTPKGTEPLAEDNLSHGSSFCFDAKAGAIAIQFDLRMREGRLMQYFSSFSSRSSYSQLPLLNQASLTQLGKREIKSLELSVSRVRQFAAAEAAKGDFEESIAAMGESFDAPGIKIELSTRTGSLDKTTVLSTIKKWLKINQETDTVKKIRAEVEGEEIPFDFLQQLLVEKGELHGLMPKAPAHNRDKRLEFLKASYAKHQKHVREILGVAN